MYDSVWLVLVEHFIEAVGIGYVSMYKSVVAELEKIPEIVECHFTTGPYTMLTKLYSTDNEHLMDLLNSRIQEIPGVVATETLISLEQSIKKEIPIRNKNK